MMEAKLKAGLWVKAHLRNCDIALIPAVVARRGDADAGTVLIKVVRGPSDCMVYAQTRDLEGRLRWSSGTGDTGVVEADADAYVTRQVRYDPDLWVLEVEDRTGGYRPDQFG